MTTITQNTQSDISLLTPDALYYHAEYLTLILTSLSQRYPLVPSVLQLLRLAKQQWQVHHEHYTQNLLGTADYQAAVLPLTTLWSALRNLMCFSADLHEQAKVNLAAIAQHPLQHEIDILNELLKQLEDFSAPVITPDRCTDLLKYCHWTRLSLQQLSHYLAKEDEITNEVLTNSEEQATKLESWLYDSCYHNQAFRSNPF